MKLRKLASIVLVGAMTLMLAGCGETETGVSVEEINVGNQAMKVSVHDPSIVKADGKYYIFGSHMAAAVSEDLTSFKSFANGVTPGNKLFDNLLNGEKEAFAFTGQHVDGYYAVWAPDVIYNPNLEKWVMYFSTSHDYRTSNICMATADTIEGPYSYQETLLYSGITRMNVENTNFYEILGEDADVSEYVNGSDYNNLVYPNCIDPTIVYDEDGRMWMVYGSWSGGMWLLELDQNTGLPIHPEADEEKHVDAYYGQYLMGGLHNSCEGPYLIYDKESGYYYLFVSYGGLTRTGGYQIRQYRAENITGPYVDTTNETFGFVANHEKYGLKVMGNYDLPSLKTAYMAPGHCSVLQEDDGRLYLVYHTRFDSGSEYHEPRVHQLFRNEEGWLVAAPFATMGETLSETGYANEKAVSGVYHFVNHGTDISADIHSTTEWELKSNGKIEGADGTTGSYKVTANTNYITITLGEVVYKGVIVEMQDEAGNAVRCITAAGNNNESIWGVFYQQ
ncbi:MAG: glycoside hydrolase family 43 protein [Lachnospiraceae bacterium]|nr:glycoside hydrolase family 43 protein [Lachnospiraceae bacterium]